MSLPHEFHRAVYVEIDTAYQWYKQQSARAAREFLDEVEAVLTLIAAHPQRYGFAAADIREATLSRFPFAVYYRELPDRIRVLSVFHTSRDPNIWQSRS